MDYIEDPSLNTTNETRQWHVGFSASMAVVLSISSIATIVGNALVIAIILRYRKMRTRTNILLINLAVADFLVGLIAVPFSITTLIYDRWIFGEGLICTLNGWLNTMCLIASLHTLMYIGIHKYYSLCHSCARPIELWQIAAMMTAAWLWAIVCATLTVTGLNTVKYKEGTSQCGPNYPKDVKGYAFHAIIQLTSIAIPCFILVFCYIKIFMEMNRSKMIRIGQACEIENSYIKKQRQLAVTLVIVLAVFILMTLPYFVYATYTSGSKEKKFSSYINPVAYCFLYLNSMANPIIYALRVGEFREGYKAILCRSVKYVRREGLFGRVRYELRRKSSLPSMH